MPVLRVPEPSADAVDVKAVRSEATLGAAGATNGAETDGVATNLQAHRRYQGVVKYWKGAYGWVECRELADRSGNAEVLLHVGSHELLIRGAVFLHRNDCDTVPGRGQCVSFRLTQDDWGKPKAVGVQIK